MWSCCSWPRSWVCASVKCRCVGTTRVAARSIRCEILSIICSTSSRCASTTGAVAMASATLSCRSGRGQGEGIHFDPIGSLPHTVLLVLIVLLYLVLALAYARATPAWQAPDEPAHFNYVRELAETGDLPVLEPGAYPASVVPLAPSARPTDISAFQYEAHQPPLFYALAALAYKLNPSLFAVRALSVLFGALLLPVAFWCSRLSVPQCPWLWLAASAFVAFI